MLEKRCVARSSDSRPFHRFNIHFNKGILLVGRIEMDRPVSSTSTPVRILLYPCLQVQHLIQQGRLSGCGDQHPQSIPTHVHLFPTSSLGRFNTYSNKGIFLVGATNNPEQLDPAVTRPGRMDRIIEMPLPDLEGRLEIMTLYNKGWAFYGPIDLREVGR